MQGTLYCLLIRHRCTCDRMNTTETGTTIYIKFKTLHHIETPFVVQQAFKFSLVIECTTEKVITLHNAIGVNIQKIP
jgi:hypothetical protein